MSKIAQSVTDGEQNVKHGIKKYIYDVVAAVIIVVIIAASLHIFNVYDLSNGDDIKNFLIDWVPYFFASVLLNADMYEKGVFVGKSTTNYSTIVDKYSTVVEKFTGSQLSAIGEFCLFYNEKSLIECRTDILRKEGISYEKYNESFEEVIGSDKVVRKALKLWKKEELDNEYGVNARKAVFAAKKAKIKGINANILLSSFNIKDPTNIGVTEGQLKLWRNIATTARYLFVSGLMSVVFIKDIAQWQWAGLIEVIFKVAYVFARAFISYFRGYSDITIRVSNHIVRKTDILNEFETWYTNRGNIQ